MPNEGEVMKSKLGSWAIAGLGVLGIVLLSGAFKSFLDWDETQGKVAGGFFTLGAGILGSMAAHKVGLIDGDTKNLVIGASVAVGTYQAVGARTEKLGSDLVSGLRKNKGKRKPAFEPGDENGDGVVNSDDDGDAFGDFGEAGFGTDPLSGAVPRAGGGPALPAAAPPQTIIYEAPKVEAPNPWVSIGVAGIGALGNVLGSAFTGPSTVNIGLPGGSGASRRRGPMSLAGFNRGG